MAAIGTPHFHNDIGVERVEIGAKKFKCTGALPPLDHPHVFLDMGSDNEIVCPYCSTLYVYKAELETYEASPKECAYEKTEA